MYDVIGDVHGYADKLEALLLTMGYQRAEEGFVPPAGRKAVFVGDLIDRGPAQLRVLRTVRAMADAGHALVVLGNHEFNAIGYATWSAQRQDFLRPHSKKNAAQHARFLAEVGEGSDEHRAWVDWFKTLPTHLELGGLRVAHAWWDDEAARVVEESRVTAAGQPVTDEFLHGCYAEGSPLHDARKLLTCGVEWALPAGNFIEDKEGHRHPDARLAIWRHWATSLREIALVPKGNEHAVPDIAIPAEFVRGPVDGAPILFGHHWFSGPVRLETSKVACLDWSAAKNGPLVAYRWDGEAELTHDRLVAVAGSEGVQA